MNVAASFFGKNRIKFFMKLFSLTVLILPVGRDIIPHMTCQYSPPPSSRALSPHPKKRNKGQQSFLHRNWFLFSRSWLLSPQKRSKNSTAWSSFLDRGGGGDCPRLWRRLSAAVAAAATGWLSSAVAKGIQKLLHAATECSCVPEVLCTTNCVSKESRNST